MPPLRGSGAGPEAEHPRDVEDVAHAGQYRLDARLGSGGMGVVHLARSSSGLRLAVKVIHAEYAQDPEFRARFRQEVAAARRVSGAFTAPVVDADTDGDRPWMATLYIPGPTLSEHVKRNGPLAPDEIRRLASGLAEALRDIHRAGVVHRDLKPGNVLLAADGPKVIDFGISRPADSEMRTETGKLIGTPPFMAPEQFQRPREVGPAADVFALGSVLVHAATGSGPFDSESPYLVAYQVVHDEADLAGVPQELEPLIRSCLAKDPADRPTPDALMKLLHTDVPTEVYAEPFPDFLAKAAPAAPAAPETTPGKAVARVPETRAPEADGPETNGAAAGGRDAATHVRGSGTPDTGPAGPAKKVDATAGKTATTGSTGTTGTTATTGPTDTPTPARARRRWRRRWPVWSAVAAVLAAAGGFAGVRMLAPDEGSALQTHMAGADATFHPWHTSLAERPPGRPSEMPFCTHGSPAAHASPALFCVQRGLKAARVDPGRGTVAWRRAGEPVRVKDTPPSAPALSGGLLYVLSPDTTRLEALDPSAGGGGATRWSMDVRAYKGRVHVVGDSVLLTAEDGTVTALDSATHRQLWRKRFPGQPLGRFTAYRDARTAYAATPSADGTSTLVTAIDPRRGTVRREQRLPGTLTLAGTGTSGALYLTAASPVLITRATAVVRLDPDGRHTRRLSLAAPLDDVAAVVHGETVYLLGDGGSLQAVGERRWNVETSVSRGSAPVVAADGERLYFSAADGRLLTVGARDGALLGQTPPRLAADRRNGFLERLPAPLLDPDRGRIYAAAPDGTVFGTDMRNPARR
ncbi:protein kinase [Streptomyces sp. MST-110588]|uniref:protein kinase domain-containing protein n=1 Tax=Streptomyces sp. MST-110588 TaxID=2833628 RepID=UPI001F5CB0A6|nr:protein kinase [Streptomyces sp. MST-110588]UNO40578.1 protein kinase [Streptomyces sp. MST-110588]